MRVKDNDMFIELIRVAQDDPGIRTQLVTILSLKKPQRQLALHSYLDELRLTGQPKEFVSAVACLLTDEVAEQTVAAVKNKLGSDPRLTESIGEGLVFAIRLFIAIPATAAALFYISMGILVVVEEAGMTVPSLFSGLAFLVTVGGGILGGMWVAKRSWLLLAGIVIWDAVSIVVVTLGEIGTGSK